MALRWLEGFENATSANVVHERVYDSAASQAFTPQDGAGHSSLEAVSGDDQVLNTPVLVGAVENSWIVGLAFRPDHATDIEDSSIAYIGFGNTDGEQIRFEFIDDDPASAKPGGQYYTIRVMRGATELATCTQKFPIMGTDDPRMWIYFEFKTTIHNTTGSFAGRFKYVVKQSLNASGGYTTLAWDAASSSIDTQEQSSAGADRASISFDTGDTSHANVMDDLYICDSTGAKNNDYLGRIFIEGQKPSTTGGGDGDTTNWALVGATNTEDALAEPLTGVENAKRITSDVAAQVHLAVMTALAYVLGGTIIGVRQDIHCRMETASGDLDIGHRFRKTTGTPAETNAGTDLNVASTTIECGVAILEDDPNTATTWVVTDLDSYQHGVINNG